MPRPQTTVLDVFRHRLETDPDGPYLDFEGEHYSARRMAEEADRIATHLTACGVGPGDRISTLLENSPEQVVSFFAALRLGAIQVPVNTAYRGEFLRHQLADSGAKVLVVQGDLVSRAAEVVGDDATPELERVVVVGEPDGVLDARPVHTWSEWSARPAAAALPDIDVRPGDIACFIYTAGTTGPSKGCMLPHNYVVSLAAQITRAWERTAADVVLTPLPLFHFNAISVCVVGSLLVGGSASIARRFSVSRFWPEVRRTGATMVSMLGSLAIMLANAPEHPDERGHRLRLCAAVPMPPDTDRLWSERFGCSTFSAGFGLTEASLLSLLPAGEPNRPGAAGRRNADEFDVRLLDDDGNEVPTGEVGEIVCRPTGPNLMFTGYWRRPDATLDAFRDLWFHTGDLARFDDDGFMYFVDRKKDSLRRRGENISSFEMERTLFAHPEVHDVAVHAVPSEVGEDDVKVTVVLRRPASVTEEQLCRWVAERVPFFAIPRYIEFRADLPRNPVGRVLKYQLRDEGVTDSTWDREAAGVTFERR